MWHCFKKIYWNRSLDSLLVNILITQSERTMLGLWSSLHGSYKQGTVSDFCNMGLHFSTHPTHPCWVLQLSCLILELSSSFVPVTQNQSSASSEVLFSWRMGLHARINLLFFIDWPPKRGTVTFTWACQGWTISRYLCRTRHSVGFSASVRFRGFFPVISSSGAKIIIQYFQLLGEGPAVPQPPDLVVLQ